MDPLDPQLSEQLAGRAKEQLRKRMRALRAAYPKAALAERNRRIVARLSELSAYQSARSLALFWPLTERQEVDLRALDTLAREAEKRVYYPGFSARPGALATELRLTGTASELLPRGHRFAEPPADAPVAARGDVDLLIVPALVVAPSGHRIGYGSGFYDAALPDFRPPGLAVVVAFDFQLLAEVPALAHDVACDVVVTDTRTLVVRDVAPPSG